MHTIYSRGIIELHYLCSCLRIQKRIYISTQSLYQVLKLLYIFKISRWCELTQHIIYVKGSILEGPDAIVEAKVPVIRATHNDLAGTIIIIICIIGARGTIVGTPWPIVCVVEPIRPAPVGHAYCQHWSCRENQNEWMCRCESHWLITNLYWSN